MLIRSHRELEVYKRAFELAREIQRLSSTFPRQEVYGLTAQIRNSSRSVCANLAEAWRRRRYEAAFVSKLNEVEAEAGETQVWIEFAQSFGYVDSVEAQELWDGYDALIGSIVGMATHSKEWCRPSTKRQATTKQQ